MKALEIDATWDPRPGTADHQRDIPGFRAQTGSRAWRNPIVRLVKKPRPKVQKPSELLIKVRACGLCGSDVHMVDQDEQGYMKYPFMVRSPHTPGHEFSGEVVNFGSDVIRFRPELAHIGAPVTTQCVMPCMSCAACADGDLDNCTFVDERGLTEDGGMAEYCVVDMRHTWLLEGLTRHYKDEDLFVAGSLIEPLTGVYKAWSDDGIELTRNQGQAVLVLGAGPIGLAATLVAQAIGAGDIFVAEISEGRRAQARNIGATYVFDPRAEPISEVVLEKTKKDGAYAVFEATGHAEAAWQELGTMWNRQVLVPRITFFGQSRKELSFDPQMFVQRFAVFTGMHGHTKVWRPAINMVAAGRINPLALSTKRIKLSQAPEWLTKLKTDKEEAKVTITDFAS